MTIEKPLYRVMSMEELRAVPWNGFTCASTFSGCGGSSTGYRMAGFRVLYANEFVDAARASYQANAAPYTVIDGRDIRTVSADSVLEAIKLQPGELDLLDGSPPCASFSTAGKRHKGWGKEKKYSDTEQRTDDLFFEFARLLQGIQPRTFVAENVSGLVKGTAKGYFKLILSELKSAGYRVRAQLLDAQWLGVPQKRQRLIFVGVREDLGLEPAFPQPLLYRYTLGEALPELVGYVQVGDPTHAQKPGNTFPRGAIVRTSDVTPAVTTCGFSGGNPAHVVSARIEKDAGVAHPYEKRLMSIAELRRICSFPDDFILLGNYAQQWERCGRAVPPVMMSHIAAAVRDGVLEKARGKHHGAGAAAE